MHITFRTELAMANASDVVAGQTAFLRCICTAKRDEAELDNPHKGKVKFSQAGYPAAKLTFTVIIPSTKSYFLITRAELVP